MLLPLQGPLQLFLDVYHVSVAWRQILLEDYPDGFWHQVQHASTYIRGFGPCSQDMRCAMHFAAALAQTHVIRGKI